MKILKAEDIKTDNIIKNYLKRNYKEFVEHLRREFHDSYTETYFSKDEAEKLAQKLLKEHK